MTYIERLQQELTRLTKEANRKYHELMSELVNNTKNYTEYEHYRDGMKFEVYTRSIR